MMQELKVVYPFEFNLDQRNKLLFLACDESSIRCQTIREIQNTIVDSGLSTVLAMPETQYQKGLRGWAKAHILAAVINQIHCVMPLNYGDMNMELEGRWGLVKQFGNLSWDQGVSIPAHKNAHSSPVLETSDPGDLNFIHLSKNIIESSNCWQDPAGCVVTKDKKIVVEGVSTNYSGSNCLDIPIKFSELPLNAGERMLFCGSLHAERVAISDAAQEGTSLAGSTLYVNKLPCRDCAQSILAAGIEKVVYEKSSYGLADIDLLIDNGVEVVKTKS